MKRRAIFLDRDGVINVNRPEHVKSWDEFRFLPNAREGLARMTTSKLGRVFAMVVVTNQAIINRGLADEESVREIHARMLAEVERAHGCIDQIYFCPHTPEEKCGCRKPQPGLYLQAAHELDLDLARSYVIGDALRDVQAAKEIGAQPILVQSGYGCEQQRQEAGCTDCEIDCVQAVDLLDAIDWILDKESNSQ